LESRDGFGITATVRREQLDGRQPPRLYLFGFINSAHRARANLAENAIPPGEHATDQRFRG
jgi:hypothetical protein